MPRILATVDAIALVFRAAHLRFLRIPLKAATGVIFLNNRHGILATEDVFFGTIDSASVHPRVVVQKAMEYNAAAAILFHNHPSGVAEPSRADEQITRRLVDALKLVDVRVLDHIVVTAGESVSFAERGLM